MGRILIKNAKIVNEDKVSPGDILLEDEVILRVGTDLSAGDAR
jgi:dihydroorotase